MKERGGSLAPGKAGVRAGAKQEAGTGRDPVFDGCRPRGARRGHAADGCISPRIHREVKAYAWHGVHTIGRSLETLVPGWWVWVWVWGGAGRRTAGHEGPPPLVVRMRCAGRPASPGSSRCGTP